MSVLDNYQCEGQMSMFDILSRDTWSGKTYQERSVQTREKTSVVSLKKFAELRIKPPQYLCLKRASGQTADVLWETGGALLGVYMISSFGDAPKDARESRLSQILEVNPHPKYSLSAKACKGILNRAEKRGKELPEQLKIALIRQSASKNEQDVKAVEKEYLSNTSEQHQSELNVISQSSEPILLESNQNHATVQTDGVSTALPASMGMGGGYVPMVTESYQDTTGALCASGYDKLGTQEAANDMYVVQSMEVFHCTTEQDKVQTLKARDYKDPQVVSYENGSSWDGSQVSPTLTANNANGAQRMPDKNNFNAVLAMGIDSYNLTETGEIGRTLTTPSGGLNEHIPCVAIDRASFNQGKNAQFDFSVQEEVAQTLVAKGPGGVLTEQ